jgi:hypothetical protein
MAIEARSVGIYKARQGKKKERNMYPCAPARIFLAIERCKREPAG